MNDVMKTTLIELRDFVNALRATHRKEIAPLSERSLRRHSVLRDRNRIIQAHLAWMVPLYDALHSAVQQAGTECTKGAQLYASRFEQLRSDIRGTTGYRQEELLSPDLQAVRLPVPVVGVGVDAWPCISIADVIAQVRQQVADENEAKLARARVAARDRTNFLASLSEQQRDLLKIALESAKATGRHAITLDSRDLAV